MSAAAPLKRLTTRSRQPRAARSCSSGAATASLSESPISKGGVMSEFVYLFRSTDAASRAAMGSPEQMQKSMQKWMAWMNQLADKGHIKDRGHPLERTGKLVRGTQKTITDGPYAEAKD